VKNLQHHPKSGLVGQTVRVRAHPDRSGENLGHHPRVAGRADGPTDLRRPMTGIPQGPLASTTDSSAGGP
jgi:hypothetical protein